MSTRLATARAALRAHLSPVMSRDHDERDRLASDVDVEAHVVSLLRHEREDSAESFAALMLTATGLSDDELQRAYAIAYDDMRDLDSGAPLQRRTRRDNGIGRTA